PDRPARYAQAAGLFAGHLRRSQPAAVEEEQLRRREILTVGCAVRTNQDRGAHSLGGPAPPTRRTTMIFTQEHEELRRTVRNFVDKEINPHVDEWEKAGRFPIHDIFRKAG